MLDEAAKLIERGDTAGAERVLTGALVLVAEHPETLRLHGLIEQRRGRLAEADALFRRALERLPDDATLLGHRGELAAQAGDNDAALALLRRAVEIAPGDIAAWLRLAIQLDAHGDHDEALAAARGILAIDARHRLAHHVIARSLAALGDIDGAAAAYRKLIAFGDGHAYQAWFSLVDLKTVKLAPQEIAALERLALDAKQPDPVRAPLNFALGKATEDAGRLADAFRAFGRANAIVHRGVRWDAAAFDREIEMTERAFAGAPARSAADIGGEVIFVVGLPRSCTTLVEQILAAHPSVEGASELPDLSAVIAAESRRRGIPFPRWVADATPADWERLGREYLARTARWRSARPRFTDKMPNNWPLIGAALAMLPQAKVVDCRRDPVETCWSCYKQMFAPRVADFSYAFADLAAYWRDYDRLMRFWAGAHPASVRAQSYEALLDDPEREIRALLDFCRLPFDARCIDFHAAKRSVRTASSGQVRQPLRDTARAAAYGDLFAPLRDALGVVR